MFPSQAFAQRQDGQVTMYLSKKFPTPPVPFELHRHILADDWNIRVPALIELASKYHKPIFERIWLCFTLLMTLVLPLASYRLIVGTPQTKHEDKDSKETLARFVGFLMFGAALLLLWTPVFVWKMIGNGRVRALLASYAKADATRPSASGFIPKWNLSIPGVFSSYTILTITTPPAVPITSFHPDAYLPVYISKTEETQGAYFYPYPAASREAGLPRMSVVGGYGAQEKV